MGRSQETYNKKEVRKKQEKKRKDKEERRLARREQEKQGTFDDMIAYVDENGMISSTPPDPMKKTTVKAEDINLNVPENSKAVDESIERTGIVTFYNESKGYGFIRDDASGENVFMHVNNMLEELREGNRVSFVRGSGQKGPAAFQVKQIH